MTVMKLLDDLKTAVEEEIKDLVLPLSIQKEDGGVQRYRAPEVHKMRLPTSREASRDAKKYAPYVLIQAVTAEDAQAPGQSPTASVGVRMVCVTYNRDDEGLGALSLWELMERIRIGLLKRGVIGGQFVLDPQKGIQALFYDDDLAPYFAGELTMVFGRPNVKREDVIQWL